jgi:amidase
MSEFLDRYDVFMTPTLAALPPPIGSLMSCWIEQSAGQLIVRLGGARALLHSPMARAMAERFLRFVPFTELANLCGTPAMSVPLAWAAQGLPVGLHFQAGILRKPFF